MLSKSMKIILLLGFVSLCGDIVYETGRSISGQYLGILGANAFLVGLVFGIGEFMGYAIRIFSGFAIDKTKNYWLFMFLGYGSILFIPLLGLTNSFLVASLFLILERIGKGLRSPAKDTILSVYTPGIKKGFVFGIHELADQIGAVGGPLIFSILLLLGLGYKKALLLLFLPFLILLISLIIAKRYSENIEVDKKTYKTFSSRVFYFYLAFVFLTTLGFIGYPLIGYHLFKNSIINENYIPMLYSFVMLVDGIFAIPIGFLYDRFSFKVMLSFPVFILAIVFLVFSNNIVLIVTGLVIWGVVMSGYETVVRAFISDTVPIESKGKFFGIFNTAFGISLFIGNSFSGYLYKIGIKYIYYFVIITQVVSMFVFILTLKRIKKNT